MHRSIRAAALGVPLALSLCACAATTVQGLQKRDPVLVVDSARDVTSIMTCVSAAWLKLGATPKSVPRENGAILVLGDAVPFLVLDAATIPTGTHVSLHQFKTMWSDNDRHRVEEVRACL